jgi:hypothetical protein
MTWSDALLRGLAVPAFGTVDAANVTDNGAGR